MSQSKISVGIHGAPGRMGRRLIQLIAEDPALALAAALVRAGHPRLGEDAGTVGRRRAAGRRPERGGARRGVGRRRWSTSRRRRRPWRSATWCRERGVPLVVGTTGLRGRAASASWRRRRREIPILISPNMSRAVNLLMKLVGEAARVLGSVGGHRDRRAASSDQEGCAQRDGAPAGGDRRPGHRRRPARSRAGPGRPGVRQPGEIGIHALAGRRLPGRAHRGLRPDGRDPGAEPPRPESGRLRAGGPRCREVPRRQAAGLIHHGGCARLTD